MLIPFDMIAVMLFLGYYAETPVSSPPAIGRSLLLLAFGCLFLFATATLANYLALRTFRRHRPGFAASRRLAALVDIGLRILLVGVFAAVLVHSDLPWSAAAALGWKVKSESLAVQLISLLPYILFFFCAWFPMYGLHRETNFGTWTRWSFLLHKARYNLFLLLAWLPFAVLADWLSEFLIALPVLFLGAAWTFPYILARAWGCRRLEDGDIMETVRRLEEKAGAAFSRVYLWEPGGGNMQNAAAVGIFRPFRYLFLTPALVRNMQGPELEAVILHELGHVKKRHLLFYLFTSLAGINLAVLVGALAPLTGPSERFAVTVILVLGYFRLVFGWLSRNMERQADLFSLEKSGAARGLANALEKLGLSAGNIRRAASWHHLGIAERVDFLRRAERDRDLARRHNAWVSRIMAAGYLLSLAAIGFMTWVVYTEYTAAAAPPSSVASERENEAHWRRVMLIMPGNPTAPLELAYTLADKPGSREEAVDLAGKAIRLSCGGQEKAAAAKLLAELGGTAKEIEGGGTACGNL